MCIKFGLKLWLCKTSKGLDICANFLALRLTNGLQMYWKNINFFTSAVWKKKPDSAYQALPSPNLPMPKLLFRAYVNQLRTWKGHTFLTVTKKKTFGLFRSTQWNRDLITFTNTLLPKFLFWNNIVHQIFCLIWIILLRLAYPYRRTNT